MAHKKAGGSAKNLTDSNTKYLGVKLYAGEIAKVGNIILRQRGTRYVAGENASVGKDHTIFASKEGVVSFRDVRKTRFDGKKVVRKQVNVK